MAGRFPTIDNDNLNGYMTLYLSHTFSSVRLSPDKKLRFMRINTGTKKRARDLDVTPTQEKSPSPVHVVGFSVVTGQLEVRFRSSRMSRHQDDYSYPKDCDLLDFADKTRIETKTLDK
jgi:hypothetical protein